MQGISCTFQRLISTFNRLMKDSRFLFSIKYNLDFSLSEIGPKLPNYDSVFHSNCILIIALDF